MKKLLVAASMLFLLVSRANALIIVVEPDNYAVGTNVTHLIEGLTISQLTWPTGSPFGNPTPPTRSDVLIQDCTLVFPHGCATGTRDFGYGYNSDYYELCVRGSGLCAPSQFVRVIEFAFDSPVSFFQVWGSWSVDPTLVYAYDALGNRVDVCSGYGGPGGCVGSYSYSSHDGGFNLLYFDHLMRDISRVVVGGLAGSSRVDQIAFNVPEPSTIALLSAGVLGLALRRRRLA